VTASDDITVGQVAERVRMLDVKCSRCDRVGRLSLSRVLLELGANAPPCSPYKGNSAGFRNRHSLSLPSKSNTWRVPPDKGQFGVEFVDQADDGALGAALDRHPKISEAASGR
jgi:hypothetical protein